MTDYTIKNFLTDVEDSAGSRAEGIDARFGRKHIDSDHLGVSLFRLAPNVRVPWGHRHREQEEAYVIVSGSGRVRLDEATRDVQQWDVIRVSPSVGRAFEAGPEGLEFIAVGNDRPEGGDGEMVDDLWQE